MSRALDDRARILEALEAVGIRTGTTGQLSAPAVLVEPGDPWSEPRRMPGRATRWQLTALAGRADTAGAFEKLGELVDLVDAALRTVPGCELPVWAKPADYQVTGVPYAGSVATIAIQTI
jgi:hypothetical protein